MCSSTVSIIIVNWNGGETIQRCINSVLKETSIDFDLIVVDNASTDGSKEYIRNLALYDKRIRLVQLESNIGFSEANNVGAKYSNAKFLVFLNPDTIVTKGWLESLLSAAFKNPGKVTFQSRLLRIDGLVDGMGDFPTAEGISLIFGHRVKRSRIITSEIFSCRAAAMMVRREDFIKLGGFDPDFFLGYEDVDFGWRFRLSGGKALLVYDSVVFHIGRMASSKVWGLESFHKHKNCISTVIKNRGLKSLFIYLPRLVVIRISASLFPTGTVEMFTKRGLSGLRALFWVLVNLRKLWYKHLVVEKRIRLVDDAQIDQYTLSAKFWVYLVRWMWGLTQYTDLWDFLYASMIALLREKRAVTLRFVRE